MKGNSSLIITFIMICFVSLAFASNGNAGITNRVNNVKNNLKPNFYEGANGLTDKVKVVGHKVNRKVKHTIVKAGLKCL